MEEVNWGMLHANLSLMRTWRAVGKEKSSAWTAIYAYAFGEPETIKVLAATELSQNYPQLCEQFCELHVDPA